MLQTKRLHLRELRAADLNSIHELHSLPETDAYNTLGLPENIGVTENILMEWLFLQKQSPRNSFIFCLDKLDDRSFIGLMGLNLGKPNYLSGEVWFKTHKDYWRQGYTSEALRAVLDFAFKKLKLHRIEAGCAVDNLASARTLEKAGFIREGRKRKKLPIRGEWVDNYFYGILEEDFKAMP